MDMASDLATVKRLLLANGCAQTVDDDVVMALLEARAGDGERAQMVVLDLVLESGFGTRQIRQVDKEVDDEVEIEAVYERIGDPDVIVLPTVMSSATSTKTERKRPAPWTSAPTLSPPSGVSGRKVPWTEPPTQVQTTESESNKRPRLEPPTGPTVAPLAPSTSKKEPSKKEPSNKETSKKETSKRPRLDPVVLPAANVPYAGLPTSYKDYVAVNGAATSNRGAVPVPVAARSVTDAGVAATASDGGSGVGGAIDGRSTEEALACFWRITGATPGVDVDCAAYEASRLAVEAPSACGALNAAAVAALGLRRAGAGWNRPAFVNQRHQELHQHVIDSFFKERLEFLVQTVPDADPEYLDEALRATQGDAEKIRALINELMERDDYPSRADYNKRKHYEELSNRFFSVQHFLETYGDPFVYFYYAKRPTQPEYGEQALQQLRAEFRTVSVSVLRQVLTLHGFRYSPAVYQLARCRHLHDLKSKRYTTPSKPKDLQLLEEVAFVKNEKAIYEELMKRDRLRTEAVEEARAGNRLLECPICCEDELLDGEMARCEAGHAVCTECLRRQSEELIGQMKNQIRCLDPQCSTEYSLKTLRGVLSQPVYRRLEKRRQAEEVLAAGIDGLESCPFCEYCEVPAESDPLFRCRNPECSKVSCRQCREAEHAPLRCEELAVRMRLLNYVEAKMTDALLRTCPNVRCGRRFVKSDGCNKMVCQCGTIMCYICRAEIRDYSHFAAPGPPAGFGLPPLPAATHHVPPGGKCPLFSDTDRMHEEEVARSAAEARRELTSQHPDIRVDLVLQDSSSASHCTKRKGKALLPRP